jgi:uncharacterized protein (DUF736 family)
MEYDNTNSGVLFREQDKKSEKHPDFTGSINVEGKDYWLSGWVNEANSGKKYFKLSVKPKDSQASKPAPKQSNSFTNEDIPF